MRSCWKNMWKNKWPMQTSEANIYDAEAAGEENWKGIAIVIREKAWEFTEAKARLFSEEWSATGKLVPGHYTHSPWNVSIGFNGPEAVSVAW